MNNISNIIENFVKTLEKNIPKENLPFIERNMGTLVVAEKNVYLPMLISIMSENIIIGGYSPQKNKITVVPYSNKIVEKYCDISKEEYDSILYHELLHMSSAAGVDKNGIIRSGFKISDECQMRMGTGINEGYTDLLCYRFFYRTNEFVSYTYESKIAFLLEKIIGKGKMTNLYFGADFFGLCKELEKYSTVSEINRFIINLDNVSSLQSFPKIFGQRIINIHNEISSFLVKLYKKIIDVELKEGKITILGYKKRLSNFTDTLHKALTSLELDDISRKKTLLRKK